MFWHMGSVLTIFLCSIQDTIGMELENRDSYRWNINHPTQPRLPLSFKAEIQIISELLPEDAIYPPKHKFITVLYDFPNRVAKATIKPGDRAKNGNFYTQTQYIKQYNLKQEYAVTSMISSDNVIKRAKCQRAYLGEDMPTPTLPYFESLGNKTMIMKNTLFSRNNNTDGIEETYETKLQHWLHKINGSTEQVQVYFDSGGTIPKALIHEDIDEENGESKELISYTFLSFEVLHEGIIESDLIPPSSCPSVFRNFDRVQTGFPFIHLFHHYLKI